MITFDTVVELTSIWVTLPCRATLVSALNVTVAGCPTLIFTASVSLNPATTCSEVRSVRVMNDELALPAEALLELELELLLELA